MPERGVRREGQRGVPRAGGRVRPLPGAVSDPTHSDEFLNWQAKYNAQGTYPEFLVFRWLEQHGYKNGLDFFYLKDIGGLRRFEGVQIDFIFMDWLALAVDGIYWHFSTPKEIEGNWYARAVAQNRGLVYVSMLDANLINALDVTMQLALVGQEMPGTEEGIAA